MEKARQTLVEQLAPHKLIGKYNSKDIASKESPKLIVPCRETDFRTTCQSLERLHCVMVSLVERLHCIGVPCREASLYNGVPCREASLYWCPL